MGKEGGKEGAEKGEEVGLNLYKESLHEESRRRRGGGSRWASLILNLQRSPIIGEQGAGGNLQRD